MNERRNSYLFLLFAVLVFWPMYYWSRISSRLVFSIFTMWDPIKQCFPFYANVDAFWKPCNSGVFKVFHLFWSVNYSCCYCVTNNRWWECFSIQYDRSEIAGFFLNTWILLFFYYYYYSYQWCVTSLALVFWYFIYNFKISIIFLAFFCKPLPWKFSIYVSPIQPKNVSSTFMIFSQWEVLK